MLPSLTRSRSTHPGFTDPPVGGQHDTGRGAAPRPIPTFNARDKSSFVRDDPLTVVAFHLFDDAHARHPCVAPQQAISELCKIEKDELPRFDEEEQFRGPRKILRFATPKALHASRTPVCFVKPRRSQPPHSRSLFRPLRRQTTSDPTVLSHFFHPPNDSLTRSVHAPGMMRYGFHGAKQSTVFFATRCSGHEPSGRRTRLVLLFLTFLG